MSLFGRHRSHRSRHRPAITRAPPARLPGPAFVILLVFLALCVIGGGGSRADILSLVYLRPAAVLAIAALLLVTRDLAVGALRPLFFLLAATAILIAAQLVPLPPDIFLALPGHARFAAAADAAGFAQPWRPLTLTPALTLNSLAACLPPLAALVGFAAINEAQRARLLPVLIGVAFLSALLGVAQLTGGPRSSAYLYTITHTGVAVGFFANRNHEATLLAATFPMLRVWTLSQAPSPEYRRARAFTATALGLFLIPMILITGSRAGMANALFGIVAAYFIAPWQRTSPFWSSRWGKLAWAGMWLLPFAAAAGVALLGRAWSFERVGILVQDADAEWRVRNLPLMLRIVADYLPFGSGFGSFDPVFRMYEPDAWLSTEYFNRAHNEPVEMMLSGGVPAALLVLVFLGWLSRAALRVFRPYRRASQTALLGRLGAVMIAQMFLASLVDYPLRTPLMAVIFVFAAGWLAVGAGRRIEKRKASGAEPGPLYRAEPMV